MRGADFGRMTGHSETDRLTSGLPTSQELSVGGASSAEPYFDTVWLIQQSATEILK